MTGTLCVPLVDRFGSPAARPSDERIRFGEVQRCERPFGDAEHVRDLGEAEVSNRHASWFPR